MQHTFGRLLDMGRLRAVPAPQIDSDGETEDWGDSAHDDVSIYRRTLNIVVSDRIDAGERPLRPTDAQERTRIQADEHDNGWKATA